MDWTQCSSADNIKRLTPQHISNVKRLTPHQISNIKGLTRSKSNQAQANVYHRKRFSFDRTNRLRGFLRCLREKHSKICFCKHSYFFQMSFSKLFFRNCDLTWRSRCSIDRSSSDVEGPSTWWWEWYWRWWWERTRKLMNQRKGRKSMAMK